MDFALQIPLVEQRQAGLEAGEPVGNFGEEGFVPVDEAEFFAAGGFEFGGCVVGGVGCEGAVGDALPEGGGLGGGVP